MSKETITITKTNRFGETVTITRETDITRQEEDRLDLESLFETFNRCECGRHRKSGVEHEASLSDIMGAIDEYLSNRGYF